MCQTLCLSPGSASGSNGARLGDLKEPGESRAGKAMPDLEQPKGRGKVWASFHFSQPGLHERTEDIIGQVTVFCSVAQVRKAL